MLKYFRSLYNPVPVTKFFLVGIGPYNHQRNKTYEHQNTKGKGENTCQPSDNAETQETVKMKTQRCRTKEKKKEQVRMGMAAGRELGKQRQAQAAAAPKVQGRELPLKNRITPNVHARQPSSSPSPEYHRSLSVCLPESSRELSSSSWGSHVTQRKMSGFLLKKFNDYIIPFSTRPDYWHFVTKHSSQVVSFYDCL